MQRENAPGGSFGDLLKMYRKRRRLTQQQLGEKIAVHRNTISFWEQGSYLPETRGMVMELARGLGLDQEETRHLLEASLFAHSAYWTIPVPRNPLFTGREQVLQMLHMLLQKQESVALTQAYTLSGLGGIGKTQLVTEYAYQHAEEYRAIFWINAETQESILASLSAIGSALQLPHYLEQQQLVDGVKRWLTMHKEWLLIIDNVEQPELVKPLIPAARQGRVLYTTRLPGLGTLAQTLEVVPLSHEESVQFLRMHAGRVDALHEQQLFTDEERAVDALASLLGGLPLALDQARAYIEQTQCSFANFLTLFRHSPLQLLGEREDHAEHPASVVKTFVLSFEKLQQTNSAAADLLTCYCFLAHEEIPEVLFTQHAALLPPALQTAIVEPFAFQNLLKSLLSYALIQRYAQRQTLVVHRLVQAVLRAFLSPEQQWAQVGLLFRVCDQAFPQDVQEVKNWSWCEQLLPHALSLLAQSEQRTQRTVEVLSLLDKVASFLDVRARYAEAAALVQRVRVWQEQEPGTTSHTERVDTLYRLADLNRKQGKYAEAEARFRDALALLAAGANRDPLREAQILQAQGNLYLLQSKLEQAETFFQQTLTLREKELGPDHIDVAKVLNNIGIVYYQQRKYTEAELLLKRARFITEQDLGLQNLILASILNSLAILYGELGWYEKADLLFQETLAIREHSQGLEHPGLLYPLNNLAELYTKQKKYPEAESKYQHVYRVMEKTLGAEHPELAHPLQGLANLYMLQGKYEEAEPIFQRALRLWDQAGIRNKEMGHCYQGLGELYACLGRSEQAEECYRQALAIREEVFGSQHPAIAETLQGLGLLWLKGAQHEKARDVLQRALFIRQTLLGPEHPDTIVTEQSLADASVGQAGSGAPYTI